MAPPLHAGCDYSTKAIHLAVTNGIQLTDAWEVRLGLDAANQIAVIAAAMERLREYHPEALTMEQLWFGGARPSKNPLKPAAPAISNINTLELHRVATRVETLALQAGIDVRWVPIASWRLVVFGHGRPPDPKAESMRYVERVYGRRMDNHNASDSVCLATYGAALARTRR